MGSSGHALRVIAYMIGHAGLVRAVHYIYTKAQHTCLLISSSGGGIVVYGDVVCGGVLVLSHVWLTHAIVYYYGINIEAFRVSVYVRTMIFRWASLNALSRTRHTYDCG